MLSKELQNHCLGSLWGGAVGDALGGPVEFMNIQEIRKTYGRRGVTGFQDFPDGEGEITDDTQMTLFTAEGLLRAWTARQEGVEADPVVCVHHAYWRWLRTQGTSVPVGSEILDSGFLIQQKDELFHLRAPGGTCLSALREVRKAGTPAKNQSKGCGTVMRIAPIAFAPFPETFELACATSLLTHAHPTGYLAAGVLAVILRELGRGADFEDAIACALSELKKKEPNKKRASETLNLVLHATASAAMFPADPRSIAMLGEGWVAEEALAIALFCALKFPDDFRSAVCLAANITGDSDSTAAITGNLLGAKLGLEAVPKEWRENLREKKVVQAVANDFCTQYEPTDEWRRKYPV